MRLAFLTAMAALGVLALGTSTHAGTSKGTKGTGTLIYDTFQDQTVVFNPFPTLVVTKDATVGQVNWSYDGNGHFTTSGMTSHDLGKAVNTDGLIFAPDNSGNLLLGGSTTHKMWEVTQLGKTVKSVSVGGSDPYHLTIDPTHKKIYSGGSTGLILGLPAVGDNPGPLGVTPWPLANGVVHTLKGSDKQITQIEFDPVSGRAYYTASPYTGTGAIGTINLTTFTTTRLATFPAAHGISYDSFTKTFILVGDSHITQFDPKTNKVVSDLNLSSQKLVMDQGITDGKGHLFVADNGNITSNVKGKLVFVDYSVSKKVGTPNFTTSAPFALALDDFLIKPPGTKAAITVNGNGGVAAVPLPAAFWPAMATLLLIAAGTALRRRQMQTR